MDQAFDAASALLDLLADQMQARRLLRLEFPRDDAPAGTLVANRLDADEGLSRDFRYAVEVLSDRPDIPLKDVLGKMVTIALQRDDGSVRYFNGYVFEFRFVRNDGGFSYYDMVLRPWLAFLSYRRDNYLFHNKSVKEQTQLIFQDYPGGDWTTRDLSDDLPMTDACQFNETDYNYLHRRWEALGWCYWYEHRKDGHQLVLSADTTRAAPIDGSGLVHWQSSGDLEEGGLRSFSPVRTVGSSLYTASSFNFKSPRPVLAKVPTVDQASTVPPLEVYEYVGTYGYKDLADGDAWVRLRMEEIEAGSKRFEADGDDDRLQCGRSFALSGRVLGVDDEAAADGPDEFLIVNAHHRASNNYHTAGGGAAEYQVALACVRKRVPWRPGRGFNSTEPKVVGVQTAIVVGGIGEEIHTDRYGRVKVQFHWDREGQFDDRSSAWIRVASVWTGEGYGFTGIPRVGQEVIVTFLDGNPDRPLVTGCLYNEKSLPAWSFPDAAHQIGFQTRSTPGGGGKNELVIHDKAGKELINILSQKDMTTTVLNDQTATVKNNKSTSVTANHSLSVGGNQSVAVTGNRSLNITSNDSVAVTGKRDTTVTGAVTETYKAGLTHTITAAGYSEAITGDYTSTLNGNYTSTCNGNWAQTVTGTSTRTVTGKVTETMGAGREVNITGDDVRGVVGKVTDGNKGPRDVSTEGPVTLGATETFSIGANQDVSIGSATTIKIGVGEQSGIEIGPGYVAIASMGSVIVVDDKGVTVNGKEIKLN